MAPDFQIYHPDLVGLGGFEPPTSPLSGVLSNQLSYRPGVTGLCITVTKSTVWSLRDSALTLCFAPRYRPGNYWQGLHPAVSVNHRFLYDKSTFLTMDQITCVGTCAGSTILFKEVIQPQVPLRLPCYDFTPVMNHTVVSALPKVKLPTSGAIHSHGVTGGVYKARERIHRDILIRDY